MILELANGDYIDEEAYGISTWGSFNQRRIEKDDDGRWIETNSVCVDREDDLWFQDITVLDVKGELESLPEGKTLQNQDEVESFNRFIADYLKKF